MQLPFGPIFMYHLIMTNAISRTGKQRGRPPTGAKSIHLRIEPELLEALDRFAQEAQATRPDAIRQIMRDWLIGHGYLPLK